jgi:hypothetical protein
VSDSEPLKITFTNLRTGRTMEVQFNPPEVESMLAANYEALKILGYSHQPLQYSHTSNLEVDFELHFDGLTSDGGGGGGANLERSINFLHSLTLSMRADSVSAGGPPDVLFVWPNLYSFRCKLMSIKRKDSRFRRDMSSTLADVTLKLARISDVRTLSDDIEQNGWRLQ